MEERELIIRRIYKSKRIIEYLIEKMKGLIIIQSQTTMVGHNLGTLM